VIFFVPDLADYLTSRTALFDYTPTAPGPLLDSTEAVAEAVRDLAAVDADYAASRKLFNERFNLLHDGHAAERVVDGFFS
jgi:CDP-glycerol glycerophosphotransferase